MSFKGSAFRRTARVAVGVGVAGAISLAATAPGAAAPGGVAQQAGFGPGTGNAIALVYKVNPIFGNLSFGITAGESVANHQNTGSSAQSKAINLGVIGVTLAGEGCKGAEPTLPEASQPQPVIATSGEPGADKGLTGDLLGLPGVITMHAKATNTPFSQAVTDVVPIGDAGGVLISGGQAKATSGVVKAGVREARAVTEVGRVSLFGGLLTLEGLRWEAVQQSGAATTNQGTFTLGAIHLAGNTIPLPPDALQQVSVLREALNALGLTITPPQTRVENGVVFVDPLVIGIVPSLARDALVGGLLGALQPVRQAFVDLINEIGCEGSNNLLGNNGKTAVTVLDLALGAISGAGSLTVELGGVQATTAEIAGFEGLGVIPPLPDLGTGGGDGGDLGSFTDGSGFGDLGDPSTTTGGDFTAPTGGPTATQPISDVDGKRGGVLLAIGGGGLLLLLLTAEADRRKMRRAQREIPLEA